MRSDPTREGMRRVQPCRQTAGVTISPTHMASGPTLPGWWNWELSFIIHVRHRERPWIVIVEPDVEAKLLAIATVYEVSQ